MRAIGPVQNKERTETETWRLLDGTALEGRDSGLPYLAPDS